MKLRLFLPLRFLTFLIPGGLLFGGHATAQDGSSEKKPPTAAAEVPEEQTGATVARISESRSQSGDREPSGYTSLTIQFEAPFENAELLRVELSGARDSLGNDLIDPKKITTETVGRIQMSPEDRTEARVSLRLAAREAESIVTVSGTVVFHDPSEAKDPIIIDNFRKHAGEFVPNEALKRVGVSVAFLDMETFDEKGGKLLSKVILGKFGVNNQEDTVAIQAATAPMKMLVATPSTMAFVIEDPKKQIIKVEGLGAEGDEASGTGMESTDGLWILPVRDPDQPVSRLRLQLKSEEAEVSRGFLIKDIPLP